MSVQDNIELRIAILRQQAEALDSGIAQSVGVSANQVFTNLSFAAVRINDFLNGIFQDAGDGLFFVDEQAVFDLEFKLQEALRLIFTVQQNLTFHTQKTFNTIGIIRKNITDATNILESLVVGTASQSIEEIVTEVQQALNQQFEGVLQVTRDSLQVTESVLRDSIASIGAGLKVVNDNVREGLSSVIAGIQETIAPPLELLRASVSASIDNIVDRFFFLLDKFIFEEAPTEVS